MRINTIWENPHWCRISSGQVRIRGNFQSSIQRIDLNGLRSGYYVLEARRLQMNRFSVSHFDGVFYALADGGMRMDRIQYLVVGRF